MGNWEGGVISKAGQPDQKIHPESRELQVWTTEGPYLILPTPKDLAPGLC